MIDKDDRQFSKPVVNTSKKVLLDTITPDRSMPGPLAVTLEASPAAPSTPTV